MLRAQAKGSGVRRALVRIRRSKGRNPQGKQSPRVGV